MVCCVLVVICCLLVEMCSLSFVDVLGLFSVGLCCLLCVELVRFGCWLFVICGLVFGVCGLLFDVCCLLFCVCCGLLL